MQAAVVTGPGQAPAYLEFPDPEPREGHEIVTVAASALTHVTRARASGAHYSSAGTFPMVVGIDGVGRAESGQRVFFVLPTPPFGGMAEKTLVPTRSLIPVPDGVDDVTAAAVGNPGMSSVAAFKTRAFLAAGETVLVSGATGTAGKLAVQLARYFGAAKVIATGRDAATLDEVRSLGADVTISLLADAAEQEQALSDEFAQGVDVVLDYVGGKTAEGLLAVIARSGPYAHPIRYVNVGGVGGEADITVPTAVLRSTPLAIMGSGIGSAPPSTMVSALGEVLQAVEPAGLQVNTQAVPLADVETIWNAPAGRSRIVFVP